MSSDNTEKMTSREDPEDWADRYRLVMSATWEVLAEADPDTPAEPDDGSTEAAVMVGMTLAAEIREGITSGLLYPAARLLDTPREVDPEDFDGLADRIRGATGADRVRVVPFRGTTRNESPTGRPRPTIPPTSPPTIPTQRTGSPEFEVGRRAMCTYPVPGGARGPLCLAEITYLSAGDGAAGWYHDASQLDDDHTAQA